MSNRHTHLASYTSTARLHSRSKYRDWVCAYLYEHYFTQLSVSDYLAVRDQSFKKKEQDFILPLIKVILERKNYLDTQIASVQTKESIQALNTCLLRASFAEIIYFKVDSALAIAEYTTISKRYDASNSFKLIHYMLDVYSRKFLSSARSAIEKELLLFAAR